MSRSKILFQIAGSISAYKACSVISRLVQEGCEVQTVASANALKFVGEATLEGLSRRPVFTDAFQSGRMMDHIELAKWADVAVLCPATARTLNQLACGTAEDPVGSLFLAFDLSRPYLVFPAMNQQMYAHPATQKSLEVLKSWGVRLFPVESGRQACGDVGPGRLLEPDTISEAILGALHELKI